MDPDLFGARLHFAPLWSSTTTAPFKFDLETDDGPANCFFLFCFLTQAAIQTAHELEQIS